MLVGHLAAGLAAKRAEPTLSLGTLVLGAMLADLLWCLFMVGGVEHVRFTPGIGAANYLEAIDIGWSHSLLMGGVWGALLAGAHFLLRRHAFGAAVLFAVVLSHWFLDVASHRPDMALAPGASERFDLGLWTSVPLTLVVEGGLWLIAIALYVRATRPRGRLGSFAFWGGVTALSLAWRNNIAGPPPPKPQTAPFASMIFFSLVVGWAYWMNRLRPTHAPRT